MAKLKEGEKLVCVPCGREIVISNCGISRTALWCCGKPMKLTTKAKSKKKTSRKR